MVVTFRYMKSGLMMMDADNGGMCGLLSHQQIRIMRLLGAAPRARRTLHTALFGDQILTGAQRASLSRSLTRMRGLGWIEQSDQSVRLTTEGSSLWAWLNNEFGLNKELTNHVLQEWRQEWNAKNTTLTDLQ